MLWQYPRHDGGFLIAILTQNERSKKIGQNAMSEPQNPLMLYFQTLTKESERGKILLLTAKIDELLCDLLKSFFKEPRGKKSDEDKLFRQMGPLSSFSSHIEMAYRVGLISKDVADCFDILRRIRNACAHGMESFSLEKEENAEDFKRFKKLSYTVAGKGELFEAFERLGLGQGQETKEVFFVILTLNHMLLLEGTLNKLRKVGDSFPNLENGGALTFDLSGILKNPNKTA